MKRLLFAVTLSALPMIALAEDTPVVAEYWTDSGSLPPEYAWETSVTILRDGKLTLKHCRGYETEGPACKTRRAKVAQATLEAIRDAAQSSGLAQKPARQSEDIMIGGGSTGGVAYLDGQKIDLLPQPDAEDAVRVGTVLKAIRAAIPSRFDHFLTGD